MIEILNKKFMQKIFKDSSFCMRLQLYCVELTFSIEIDVNEISYYNVIIIGQENVN